MNNVVVLMTILGGFAVVLYYVLKFSVPGLLSAKFRYNMLKLAIILFLIPFQEFKYLLPVEKPYKVSPMVNFTSEDFIDNYIIRTRDAYTGDHIALFARICIALSAAIIILYAGWYFIKYIQGKRLIRLYSHDIETPRQVIFLEKVKAELGLKQEIRFVFSEFCNTPITVGLSSPVVIFPLFMKDCTEQEWDFAVRHELNHIKCWDVLTIFFSFAVVVLHWFNPLAYLLCYELSNMCEIQCDSRTIKNYSQDTRKKYGEYLISLAARPANNPVFGAMGLLGSQSSFRRIQRRLLEMKNPQTKSKKIVSVMVSLVIALAGSVSVFAYDPPIEIEISDSLHLGGNFVVSEPLRGSIEIETNLGNVFKDNEGNVYNVSDANRAICFHQYTDVSLQYHDLHSDGSCTITYYDAKRCTKCGNMKDKTYSYEMTCNKCPH